MSIAEQLRDKNLRATPARIAIIEVLGKAKAPLSIQRLQTLLLRKKIDQATVYRTLETLEKVQLVRQVDLRHGHAHYELVQTDHHHVVCRQCGTVADFSGCDASALRKIALRQVKNFAVIEDHAIELFGLCNGCTKKRR